MCLCGGIVAAGSGTRAILVHALVLVHLVHRTLGRVVPRDARDQAAALPAVDLDDGRRVFAKTHHAVPLFEALGCRTEFVGFTSFDRLLREVPREPTFFHLGGRSVNKGSRRAGSSGRVSGKKSSGRDSKVTATSNDGSCRAMRPIRGFCGEVEGGWA